MSDYTSIISAGQVAVVTGAASGIGLAAARHFAALEMKVVLVDRPGAALDAAAESVKQQSPMAAVRGIGTDVANLDGVARLAQQVSDTWGPVAILMNNAAVGNNAGLPWEHLEQWRALLEVNLWGVINLVQAFVPRMLAGDARAMIINTGSKQGITNPPGNPAYNMSKAAVRNYTETLAHELRGATGGRISAHLLIPGFTYTGMTRAPAKPAAAWSAEQVVAFMLSRLAAGDFYILCPDNAVDRATDEKRMRWAMDDLILNRPALSRWHPNFEAAFADYMAGG